MKKLAIKSLIILVALSSNLSAFAAETAIDASAGTSSGIKTNVKASTTNARPLPVKAMIEAKGAIKVETKETIKDIREKMASSTAGKRGEIRDERKEYFKSIIKTRIEAKYKKMFLRYQATIDRERAIMEKINTRIVKLKESGVVTTTAEKFTALAKTHLDLAQASLISLKSTATGNAEIDAQYMASTTSSTPTKDTLQKMQKLGAEVERNIKEAHKALENSVRSLKELSTINANTRVSATSTTTINN